jgi:hypothetical protein
MSSFAAEWSSLGDLEKQDYNSRAAAQNAATNDEEHEGNAPQPPPAKKPR